MNLYVACAICFGLGYVLGRLDGIVRLLRRPGSDLEMAQVTGYERVDREFPANFAVKKRKVSIDDSKFVTDVSTDGMESIGTATVGTITQTEDSISSAANKLAQLKKLKG